jgi:hypothetical protein
VPSEIQLTWWSALVLLLLAQACIALPVVLWALLASTPLRASVADGALRVDGVRGWAPRVVPVEQIAWCQAVTGFRAPPLSLPSGNTRLTNGGDWLYGTAAALSTAVTWRGSGLLVGLATGRRLFLGVPYATELAEALRGHSVRVVPPGDHRPVSPLRRP